MSKTKSQPKSAKAAKAAAARSEKLRKAARAEINRRIGEKPSDGGREAPKGGPRAKDATVGPVGAAKGKDGKGTKGEGTSRTPRRGVLEAAADVLKVAGKPMHCKPIMEGVLKRGLWKTTGKTPHATLFAALIREIGTKGKDSRFRKTARGEFALAGKGG